MPSYRVHAIGAIVVQVGIVYAFHATGLWICTASHATWMLLWAIMGGLFPDVDTKSKIQRPFYLTWVVTVLWLAYFGDVRAALALALLGYAPLLVHHRGLFHAWWLYGGCAALTCLWWTHGQYTCASRELWLCLALLSWAGGAVVHIMLDRWKYY